MLIKRPSGIKSSEITDRGLYVRRRDFLRTAIGTAALAGAAMDAAKAASNDVPGGRGRRLEGVTKGPFRTDEELTPYKAITTYNNFFEFGTDKDQPSRNAARLKTSPWTIAVEGEAGRKGAYQLEDFIKPFALEERVYRMRCVEGWSMVIPWVGFPLSDLIKKCEPTSNARFVEFTTLYDRKQMVSQRPRLLDWLGDLGLDEATQVLEWPYLEALRLDEAMHPLTILAVGLYGEVLPNQNGAPIRLVMPWKYGFKSIKSIVKIRFVKTQPFTTWQRQDPSRYGFYSNVNPDPVNSRWDQATERRIGEFFKRKTLLFNGYAEQVASLYAGLDLKKNF